MRTSSHEKIRGQTIKNDKKWCQACTSWLPFDDFYTDRSTATNLRAYCRDCDNNRVRQYQALNKEKVRENARTQHLRRKYRITPEQYKALLKKQGGKCAICRRAETSRNTFGEIAALSIDHDHSTGQIRGLLCRNCNSLIGMAQDNIDLLKKAINYLKGRDFDQN